MKSLSILVSKKRIIVAFVILLLLVGMLSVGEYLVAQIGISREWVQFLTVATAIVLLGSILKIIVLSNYRRKMNIVPGEQDNFVLGIDSATNAVVVILILGSVFPVMGVPFGSFLTSLSVFSVALVWLLKEYLTNFIDSFRLMFSNDFLIGDYIKVNENSKGIITDISFRATKVKTDEGDVLFIPNSTLMNTEVVNYSKVRLKRIIVQFTLPTVSVGSVSELEQVLTEEVNAAIDEQIDSKRTFLRILGVKEGESSFAFEISIHNYSFASESKVKRAIYERVIDHNRNFLLQPQTEIATR